MGELYGRWATAVDANLNAYPGAKLGTFDSVATTTPKETYSDPDLTTPHTNPVIANSSGQFPQIFAEVGEAFYLTLKTAADVLVEDFEDVAALGASGDGTFARDFGSGGRWEVSGVAGVVSEEFGPPAGDDIGGTGRIGGWNGTQGETLTVDFETVAITEDVTIAGDLVVTGQLTVSGAGSTVLPIKTAGATVTNLTEFIVPLDQSFEEWEIHIRNMVGTTNGDSFTLTFSFDNGVSYEDGATDYLYNLNYDNGSSITRSSSAGAAYMLVAAPFTGGSPNGFSAVLRVFSRSGVSAQIISQFGHVYNDAAYYTGTGVALIKNEALGKATHVKFTFGSSTTASLKYSVIAIP